MTNSIKFDPKTVQPIVDPTTGSGDIHMFPDAMGQQGRPFVFLVEDPPNKTRSRHYHHGDVIYFYTKGEHHIEGEGTFRAGDVRWTKAGHRYGPETTGDEGGAWWVISYNDPIPVDVDETEHETTESKDIVNDLKLPEFSAPFDWQAIDACVKNLGGAIIKNLVDSDQLNQFNGEVNDYLGKDSDIGIANSGSQAYDKFLGAKTVRLQGMIDKVPTAVDLIGNKHLVDWAKRMLKPQANSILLNAGELIQIEPKEPAQFLHRDSDSWAAVELGEHPIIVNAIVACGKIDKANGATYITPGSWAWEKGRQPKESEMVRAEMDAGDAVLFRADLIHGGGENNSPEPRRALSITYCAGWLRPVENSFLNIPLEKAKQLPTHVQSLLGYESHSAVGTSGGLLGLYDSGDPTKALSDKQGK